MDSHNIKKEIQLLKIGKIFHIFIYLLLSFCHILVLLKSYWLSKTSHIILTIETIIIGISMILPAFFLILLICVILTEKKIEKLGKISRVLCIIFLVNSLITSGAIWYNTSIMGRFYEDCPYNFNIDDIPNIFSYYQTENKTKRIKECNNRRCFSINSIDISYVCNFNDKKSQYEYEFSFDEETVIYNNVKDYIYYCLNYTQFYKINKTNYNLYKNIPFDFICLTKSQFKFNYLLSYLFIFSCIFASSLPWVLDFQMYDKILYLLLIQRITNNRNNSLKETNNTSNIEAENNNNNNNEENNSQKFTKQPTEILIIGNNNYININNINNENNQERIVNIITNNIDDNKKNENNLKDQIINNNNDLNNNSKSENNLMNNENKNVFTIINKRVKSNSQKNKKEIK